MTVSRLTSSPSRSSGRTVALSRGTFLAVIAALPLLPEGRFPVVAAFSLCLPLLAIWALAGAGRRAPEVVASQWPWFGFALVCAVSILAGPRADNDAVGALVLMLAHLAAAVAVAAVINTTEQTVGLLRVIVLSGVGVSGLGLLQYGGLDVTGLVGPFKGRATATFANPNHLGGFLACLVPAALWLVLWEPASGRRSAWSAGAVLLYAGLVISASRGGWWACLLASPWVFVLVLRAGRADLVRRAWRPIAAFGIAAVLVTVAFSVPGPMVRHGAVPLGSRIGGTRDLWEAHTAPTSSVAHRKLMWRVAVAMVHDHPLLGVGYGAFHVLYPPYRDRQRKSDAAFPELAPRMAAQNARFAHNEYLNLLAEAGPLALLAFLLASGIPLARAVVRRDPRVVAPVAVAGALLLHSLVSYPLRLPAPGVYFWAAMGLLSAPSRRDR